MTETALPTDAAIKDNLARRIDRQRDGVGIVVGVIDRDGRRVVAHGRYKRGGKRQVDGDTLFEIGSNTKVITSLLLCDMARRGEVRFDDPVAKHLPDGVTMPERGGRSITFADLATHMSGLPREPANFAPKDRSNPFADYTVEQLYAFLNGHALTRDIGAHYAYSNVGVGLLGHVLARRCGMTYEDVVRDRITGPLGMRDTAITLSPDLKKRLAHGHGEDGRPVPNWDLSEAFTGAGALRSTANDLLTFLAAALGYQDSPLKPAMDDQLAFPMRAGGDEARHPSQPQEDRNSIGLGWHAIENERGRVVMHGGGTGGYLTFMGLNLARGWGAVVLTNMFRTPAADIGVPILLGAPLALAPGWRRAIIIEPSVLDRYVGRYRFSPQGSIEIAPWNGGLIANVEGMGEAPIYADSATRFFWRVSAAELTFETDADGAAIALVIRGPARGESRAVRE